jgi:hypothetical protein
MSKKSFQIVYKVDAEQLEQVLNVTFEILGETGMEPTEIILPDGRHIPYSGFLADKFAAEGHISEAEFIELSLTPNTVVK